MISKYVTDIMDSLMDNPTGWTQRENTLKRTDGLEIWTANGFFFLQIYRPQEIKLSFIEKICVALALRSFRKELPLSDLMKGSQ